MFMVSRRVVCGFFLFAPVLYAQDNSLDRPASDFFSNRVGLTETLLKFSHQQHLRIAVEYVDRTSMNQPIVVNLQNGKVSIPFWAPAKDIVGDCETESSKSRTGAVQNAQTNS